MSVEKRLSEVYLCAREECRRRLPVDAETKLVIFSDHHKGAQNRADDFRHSHPAYNAALISYLERGYTLIILGDAEELWQERPERVFKAYRRTFDLESAFHRAGEYYRVWGNHDINWKNPAEVKKFFHENDIGEIETYEGIIFEVTKKEQVLGEIFLTHGHQGTLKSDRLLPLARRAVQWIWRPVQKLTGCTTNTPATIYDLRKKHDRTMYEWGADKERFILITGHTHRPVFCSQTHLRNLEDELADMEKNLDESPDSRKLKEAVIEKKAEIEYRRAKDHADTLEPAMLKPAYFNTGCCCYSDGDITGIEICYEKGIKGRRAGVYIKLIRWSAREGIPRKKEIRSRNLEDILNALQ